jgi:type II secretory pathway pseudopilin PulG
MSQKKHKYPIFNKSLNTGCKSSGFSIIELVFSMAVLVFVFAAMSYAYIAISRELAEEMSQNDNSMNAYKALERMTNELRTARQIFTHTSSSITFWLEDTDGDSTSEAAENVTYTFSSSQDTITRTLNTTSVKIAQYIDTMTLTYDAPAAPRRVTIKITALKDGLWTTAESSVNCRNL